MLRGLILLLSIYLFVFINDSKLNFSTAAYAVNLDNHSFPQRVYRATPSKPDKVFKYGFKRNASGSTSLAQHIQADPGQQSVFISTTSSYKYAVELGRKFAATWWDVDEFYVYEVIPQSNFINVSNVFYSTYNHHHDHRKSLIENYSTIFTIENEFAAMNYIPPETIVLATRYVLSGNEYISDDGSYINNITRTDSRFPVIEPKIYNDSFPLGTVQSAYFEFYGANPNFACFNDSLPIMSGQVYIDDKVSKDQLYHVKKRDISGNANKLICPSKNLMQKKSFYMNMPDDFLEKNKNEFKFSTFNLPNICLTPNKGYIGKYFYVSIAACSEKQIWSFTEFGQIITQVNDGQYNQYYCLKSPRVDSLDRYIRLEICDISVKEQKWIIEKFENKYYLKNYFNQALLLGSNNFVFMSNEPISAIFLDKNKNSLSFTNATQVLNSTTEAFIQFSMDLLYTEDFYVMYPTSAGNVFQDFPRNLLMYKHYYNAHNNALFSSFGNKTIGPQVCYMSALLFNGGSSWDWVKNDYCSTQGEMRSEYKWILHYNTSLNEFNISDFAGNLLKFNDITASANRYFAYTANTFWKDSNAYLRGFIFNDYAKIYAFSFTSFGNYNQNKQIKILQAFDAIKEYYYRYQITKWATRTDYYD
ncbi:hypothetical protein [Spirobacillus cienkowskii]|uniref:hypothetical protein n=1 Tax=Spirobacillus cienkowskii TaxID=495820 RepID=UPI0030CD2AAC